MRMAIVANESEREIFTKINYELISHKCNQLLKLLNHTSIHHQCLVKHIYKMTLKGRSYLWVSPNAKSSIVIVYGPAKSWMTPSLIAIPVWPMGGRIHVMTGIGVQTIQNGKRACLGLIFLMIVEEAFCFGSLSVSVGGMFVSEVSTWK